MYVIMRPRPDAALTVDLFTPDGDGPYVRIDGLDHCELLTPDAARQLADALIAAAEEHDAQTRR